MKPSYTCYSMHFCASRGRNIEEHLARVSHRLNILEETVITEQESSLKALEAILTAAKNRKQRNIMVENEGDQSLV